MMSANNPDDSIEKRYIDRGINICGIDEVGRGSWAGPLVMAAVIPGNGIIEGVKDSKKVSPKKREALNIEIHKWARSIGIGIVSNNEIDEWGMARSLRECALRAIESAESGGEKIEQILLDGHYDFIKKSDVSVATIVKGDSVSHAIAAASIVAKVHRDTYMASDEIASEYGEFCFASNKGYPSPVHKQALKELGPTPLHRVSWDIFGDSFSNNVQEVLI